MTRRTAIALTSMLTITLTVMQLTVGPEQARALHSTGYPSTVSMGPNLSAMLAPLDPDRRIEVFVGIIDPGRVDSVRHYYHSGAARRDQAMLVRRAEAALGSWSASFCPEGVRACRGTVVMDIDDTVLDSSTFYEVVNPPFTFDREAWSAFRDSCRQRVITPSRGMIRRLHAAGWHVVLLTGRSETARAATVLCLRRRGVDGWDELVMRRPADASLSASRWKARHRTLLEGAGWRIAASIGDQMSDMPTAPETMGFLMPNPIYAVS